MSGTGPVFLQYIVIYSTFDLPSVSIQSPNSTPYTTSTIPVNFTATDNIGISSCVVRLNGTVNSSTCNNYTLTLSNGNYTLNVTVNDTAGNVNSAQVSFTVATDTTPPSVPAPSVSNSSISDENGIAKIFLAPLSHELDKLTTRVGSQSTTVSFSLSEGVQAVTIQIKVLEGGRPSQAKNVTAEAS